MKRVQYHPLAEVFPRMPDGDFKALVQSIGEFGLRQKIVLYEGKILDGRHRYEACLAAGVKPQFEQYEGKSPIGFVISANLNRRHLDTSQRALIAASIETTTWGDSKRFSSGEKDPKSPAKSQEVNLPLGEDVNREQAAELMNVSEASVKRAAKLMEEAPPEIIEKVKSGEMSVNAALAELKEDHAPEENGDVVDETGWPVPKSLRVYWDRRGELLEIMKKIASIKNHLEERWREGDEFYKRTRSQDAIIKLNDAHRYIRASQLFAVCPTCNGRAQLKGVCTLCKGAGILTKHLWQQCVPEETKRMRERQINMAKQKGKV